MVTQAEKPIRSLSALQIAKHLNRKKRAVLNWPREGCPCTLVEVRGQQSPQFNLEEVRAWLKSKGRDVPADVLRRDAPVRQLETGELFDQLLAEMTGPLDHLKVNVRLRAKFEELMKVKVEDVVDPSAMQKWATAAKNLISEMRALEVSHREQEMHDGKFVRREESIAIHTDMAVMVRSDYQGLPPRMLEVISKLCPEALGEGEEADRRRRVLLQGFKEVSDGSCLRMAESIAKAIEQSK